MEDATRILRKQYLEHPSMYLLSFTDVEKAVLQEHLYRLCEGHYRNLQDVADVLGVSRHTLRRKMLKHGFKCTRVDPQQAYILLVTTPEG